MSGRLCVGKSKYVNNRVIYPEYPEFTAIIVLTKTSSLYGELGPYDLKNEQGQIIENVWQFAKVYKYVPESHINYSTGNPTSARSWPKEIHVDINGNLTNEYYRWRLTGKNNKYPVRNPVGWSHLKNCLYALEKDELVSESNPKLDYIEARKNIYLPNYWNAVVKKDKFWELRDRLLAGENLLIIEIDGPHQESLVYYKQKYSVGNDFIHNDSVEVTESNMSILINDSKHPFGHGYCLAWTLYHNLST